MASTRFPGELSDACASLLRNNGKLYSQMDNNGDGSRCGQAFNSVAYGGVSNASYGTLTAGRQQSLMLDGVATYDPMMLSYAFSVLGYSGTPAAGIGSTETARWNNSVKYVYQFGPLHAAGMYSSGGQDTPMMGQGFGANIGGAYRGFSIDGFYTRQYGSVNLSSFANPANTGSGTFPLGTSCTAGIDCPNELVGTITNNEAWSVMAKYSFNIEEPAGGLKDERRPNDKLTLFAGFVYIDLSNPDHRQSFYNGFSTIGGYQFFTLGAGGIGSLYDPANDRAFGSDRIQNTEWAGIRYDFSWGLSLTGAYYHWGQDAFLQQQGPKLRNRNGRKHFQPKTASPSHFVGNTAGANCAGDFNQAAFLADYVFNKHFDVYAGVSYTMIDGGLASAFLNDNMVMFATGMRLKF